MTFQERIKAYQRKDKQIIVSTRSELTTKWSGKTLGEILSDLGVDSEPEFIHWGDQNVAGFRVVVDGVDYFFNCSESLAAFMEAEGFPGDVLSLEGRSYKYERTITERGIEDGKRYSRVKRIPVLDDKGAEVKNAAGVVVMKDATEIVDGFNIGLPTGFRNVNDQKGISALEMSAEQAAKLLGA